MRDGVERTEGSAASGGDIGLVVLAGVATTVTRYSSDAGYGGVVVDGVNLVLSSGVDSSATDVYPAWCVPAIRRRLTSARTCRSDGGPGCEY